MEGLSQQRGMRRGKAREARRRQESRTTCLWSTNAPGFSRCQTRGKPYGSRKKVGGGKASMGPAKIGVQCRRRRADDDQAPGGRHDRADGEVASRGGVLRERRLRTRRRRVAPPVLGRGRDAPEVDGGSEAEYRNVRWSPKGEFLASASDALRVWTKDGDLVHVGDSPDLLWGLDWDGRSRSIVTVQPEGGDPSVDRGCEAGEGASLRTVMHGPGATEAEIRAADRVLTWPYDWNHLPKSTGRSYSNHHFCLRETSASQASPRSD